MGPRELVQQVRNRFPDGVNQRETIGSYLEGLGYHETGSDNKTYVFEGDGVSVELMRTYLLREEFPDAVKMVARSVNGRAFGIAEEIFASPPVSPTKNLPVMLPSEMEFES